jgi:hypothetical protein
MAQSDRLYFSLQFFRLLIFENLLGSSLNGADVAACLVPGANVLVASNPPCQPSRGALWAGLERRGEIVRLVMTMRGGDRPKSAHEEFWSKCHASVNVNRGLFFENR